MSKNPSKNPSGDSPTDAPEARQHWADRVAVEVLALGRDPVISTGISPSGEIHIGNMREVLTGDAVFRALRDAGAGGVRFNYVADNYDPLRKVYPFLDPEKYRPLIGRPISEIPCPCGKHESYADHFLEPFLAALAELRVDVELERADLMYKSGRMTPYVIRALEARDTAAAILTELTNKEVAPDWSPFNVLCPDCGRMTRGRVVGFSAADKTVDYVCDVPHAVDPGCGSRGTIPIAGGGKLVWRIDWAARWAMLGVTVEPFGKDHATRGGSYDTGVRLVRELFDGEAPFPIPYEWVRLSGGGDMSSSKGNVLSISRILEVAPPEALRYLILRDRPQRRINFDPGLPLLQLVDQVDDPEARGRDARSVELSQAGGFEPVGVPYKHLVVVAQAAAFDAGSATRILMRSGYPDVSRDAVAGRMAYARRWLEAFAPEDLKFTVQAVLPEPARELDEVQRRFLKDLAGRLQPGMDGEAIHAQIHGLSRELSEMFPNAGTAELFRAIYLSLLGKPRGPRAGWFIAVLGVDFCIRRFQEAAGEI